MLDKGLQALAGLTALTNLNLWACYRVSDDGLQALDGLNALTSLNIMGCFERVSDNGLRALGGLTALTDLNFTRCNKVSNNGFRPHWLYRRELERVLVSVKQRVARSGQPHWPHQPQF
jgi:hypothetical protein